MLSKTKSPEPRLHAGNWYRPIPFFGTDIGGIKPGEKIVIKNSDLGHPVKSLKELPAGKYYFQALINIYTRFERSDGHIIREPWARILFGCSTGGWISLALQVFHPDFFGGQYC